MDIMEREEAAKNLKALGFRVPLDTVVTVVQRLQNRDSLYRIYSETSPWISKGTVRKIRDLLKDGKLNFVLDLKEAPPLLT